MRSRIIFLILIGSIFISSVLGVVEWTHEITLPGDGNIQFKWTNTNPEWVTMEMRGKTTGYVGIGFSPSGGMPGADIVLGWIDESGIPHLYDYHGITNGMPIQDPQQDYELLYGYEKDGETVLGFRRKWDTCDENDMIINDDTVRLIWAWSPTDPINEKVLQHHGLGDRRGVRSIHMRTPPKPLQFPDDDPERYPDVQHWDITMYNVNVAQKETWYNCRIYQFPKLFKKHHIIGYRPLISEEKKPYVHHINVYNCHVPESLGRTEDFFAKYTNHRGADCLTDESPLDWREYCYAFRVAVGVGDDGDMYPMHVGDPIGNDAGDHQYLKLEVHYNNPYSHKLMDSSGIRIFYTDKLREYDVGMLFAGYRRTPFLSIPPFQSSFKISGLCGSTCTESGLPPTGIKIISVLLHAHLSGRKLVLRHIRQGRELPPIASDNHFDFNYQAYRKLPKEITFLPGDELIMECEYETKGNTSFILGGLSTRQEMCEAFIYHYPKTSLADCRSQIEYYSYLDPLGVKNATGNVLKKLNIPYNPALLPFDKQNLALPDDVFVMEFGTNESKNALSQITIRSPESLFGQNLFKHMHSLNWANKNFAKAVENAWRVAPRYMHCSTQGGNRIQISNHIVKIGDFVSYPKPKAYCTRSSAPVIKFSYLNIITTISILYYCNY